MSQKASKTRTLMLAAPLMAVVLATYSGWARAGDDPGSDDLKNEVSELKQEVDELRGEVKTLKTEQAVAAPAAPAGGGAAPAPATIGQHVGSLENDLTSLKTDLSTNLGVHVHGLVDAGYEYNFNKPAQQGPAGGSSPISSGGRVNQLRTFDVDANGFNLQQFNLHIDKEADGGVGFVSDINFGQTANVLRASTRNSNLNPAATSNDIVDPTQAYLTYTVPVGSGINLQLGRFVTLLGEEIIPTYNNQNFNESHSFIFGFGIPFTHTGLRGTYAFNDKVSLTLGVNNGWDDISDNNDGQSIEGELSLTPTSNLSLVLNGIEGPEQVNRGNSRRWAIDPVATWHTPISGLQLIGEYLYAQETGPVYVTPITDTNGNSLLFDAPGPSGTVVIPHDVSWTGAAGYIVYDYTDRIEFALRGEWFDDSDGARTGLRQTLGEVTGTINYKVPKVTGLLARLEYRHDESSAAPFWASQQGVVSGTPAHTISGQDTVMAVAIYSF